MGARTDCARTDEKTTLSGGFPPIKATLQALPYVSLKVGA